MLKFNRRALALFLLMTAAVAPLSAGPIGDGLTFWGGNISGVIQLVGEPLGVACTLLGGGKAAWAAAHGESFTGPLLAAVVGAALLAGMFLGLS